MIEGRTGSKGRSVILTHLILTHLLLIITTSFSPNLSQVFGHGGGGGILSTANDYMRFTQWLASRCTSLDGEAKALISPALVKEMQVRILT